MGMEDGVPQNTIDDTIRKIARGDAKIERQMRSVDPLAAEWREKLGLDHNDPVHALALTVLIAELIVDRAYECGQVNRIATRISMIQGGIVACCDVRQAYHNRLQKDN